MVPDDLTIYIPTHGRLTRQVTWAALPPSVREITTLVAEETEADVLQALGYPVIPHQERGIGDIREWVLRQHTTGGYVLLLDDDLRIDFRRRDDRSKFLKPRKGEAIEKMVREYRRLLDFAPLAGIAPRGGANRTPSPYRFNTRMFGAWGGDPSGRLRMGVQFNRVSLMEDFDVFLQVLSRGHMIPVLNTFVVGDAASNTSGGCSSYRTNLTQSEAAVSLAELWPDYVKLVERPAWDGMEGDTRLDVRIQWGKAYKDGVRARGEESNFPLDGESAWYTEEG